MSRALSGEISRRSESKVTIRPILFHINISLNIVHLSLCLTPYVSDVEAFPEIKIITPHMNQRILHFKSCTMKDYSHICSAFFASQMSSAPSTSSVTCSRLCV